MGAVWSNNAVRTILSVDGSLNLIQINPKVENTDFNPA